MSPTLTHSPLFPFFFFSNNDRRRDRDTPVSLFPQLECADRSPSLRLPERDTPVSQLFPFYSLLESAVLNSENLCRDTHSRADFGHSLPMLKTLSAFALRLAVLSLAALLISDPVPDCFPFDCSAPACENC